MLDIPPSTLRRDVKLFAYHLSETAARQRSRRYTDRDITVLAQARELMTAGRSPHETDAILGLIEKSEPAPGTALALVPSISAALTKMMETAQDLRMDVDELEKRVADLERPLWRRLLGL